MSFVEGLLNQIKTPKPAVKNYKRGDIVTATVQYAISGFGLVVWLDGARYIILLSELGWFGTAYKELEHYKFGDTIQAFYMDKLNETDGSPLLSVKRLEQNPLLLYRDQLQLGETYQVRVKRVSNHYLVVGLSNTDLTCTIRASELDANPIYQNTKFYPKSGKFNVMITKLDIENGRMEISKKQLDRYNKYKTTDIKISNNGAKITTGSVLPVSNNASILGWELLQTLEMEGKLKEGEVIPATISVVTGSYLVVRFYGRFSKHAQREKGVSYVDGESIYVKLICYNKKKW